MNENLKLLAVFFANVFVFFFENIEKANGVLKFISLSVAIVSGVIIIIKNTSKKERK